MKRHYDEQGEYVPGWDARVDWLLWKLYRAWYWLPSKVGYWTWEHEFKTCPAGEHWCPHKHYRLGRRSNASHA